jgi:YkoY family integral membrane protein
VDVQLTDLFTVLLLVGLEGLLSADNAIVLAILVLGLPRDRHHQALRYGLLGAFAMRIITTMAAAYLIGLTFVKLIGAAYLLYLPFQHFFGGRDASQRRTPPKATAWLGMNPFWATVVKVELTNLVFSFDSILVAVAMSPKLWVILTGGLLGIVMMRVVIGQMIALVERFPALVDGAFVIIAWVGVKLLVEYFYTLGYVPFVIPQWFSLTLIVVIFAGSFLLARTQERRPADERLDDDAAQLLKGNQNV